MYKLDKRPWPGRKDAETNKLNVVGDSGLGSSSTGEQVVCWLRSSGFQAVV